MSFSINRVTLKGNLGKDPEIRALNNGDRVASFSIATSETWTDKNSGEKKERTEWHNVVVWPKWAVEVADRLKKGDSVLVEGKLSTRAYETNDGQKRWTTEVVLNGFDAVIDKIERGQAGNRAPGPNSREDYGTQGPASGGTTGDKPGGFSRDLDDEIPF